MTYLLLPVPSSSRRNSWCQIDPHQFPCRFSAGHKSPSQNSSIIQSMFWLSSEAKYFKMQPACHLGVGLQDHLSPTSSKSCFRMLGLMQQPEWMKALESSLNAHAEWHYCYQSGNPDTKLALWKGEGKYICDSVLWTRVKPESPARTRQEEGQALLQPFKVSEVQAASF